MRHRAYHDMPEDMMHSQNPHNNVFVNTAGNMQEGKGTKWKRGRIDTIHMSKPGALRTHLMGLNPTNMHSEWSSERIQ